MNNVGRLALRVPVLGWLIHDAVHGLPDAKYYFIVNCLLVLAMLIYTIGYPLVIILALSATAGALFLLVFGTAQDGFSKMSQQQRDVQKRRPRRPI